MKCHLKNFPILFELAIIINSPQNYISFFFTIIIKTIFKMNPSSFGCAGCLLDFPNLHQYVQHRKNIHQDFIFDCPVCSLSMPDSAKFNYMQLFYHYKDEHMQLYKCKVCHIDEDFGSYQQHQVQHIVETNKAFCIW